MKVKMFMSTFLLCIFMMVNSIAQNMPFVYDIENTGADCPKPPLPTLAHLSIIQNLPDPFMWSDGRGRISNFSDLRYRRAEIAAEIQNYEIGEKPVRPSDIKAAYDNGVLTVIVTVNGVSITLTSQIVLPSGTGPFPAVIGMNSPSGSLPSSIFTSRKIAQITFNHNQVTTYGSPKNTDPYYKLYPNLNIDNTGQYSAWAWGVSRIIDGLELVKDVLPIDIKHLAVTGCSYAGKLALFAGAFDERIALTIAQESGGGGATSWRYSHSEPSGTVEKIDNTDSNWFMNSMKQFAGDNVSKMPEDHHELMAMCAPRALLVTANPDYTWLSNPSSYVCSKACQQIYNVLGISDRFGFSIIGGHGHCAVPNSQITEIEAFVEKFLLGNTAANTNITTTPYNTNLASWIIWTTPTLANGTSFFEKASLIYPANLQKGLDKSTALKWKKVKDAAKYFIKLSTDPAFTNIDKSDSTTTDTVKTFTGLMEGKSYYWRVQVKNASGSLGPWSDPWNFSTYVALPAKPLLVSATPVSNRSGYIALTWNKVKNADKYVYQLSDEQSFATYSILDSTGTSDTVKTLMGLYEGQKYYWRIRAKNITGAGLWSDALSFTTLLTAPTDLVLKKSAAKEITLKWNNNTSIQDGNVIERKLGLQTSFTILDTLKGSGSEYFDKKITQTETYIYRIKAYTKFVESSYSNEASLYLVGVKEEEMPTEYSMSQNFPNPFNPTTKLKFALPQRSLTKLVVYDLLGREVVTLINKELEAGFHEINFDANNFPSGVYYYRIQSGDPSYSPGQSFIETKKMILVK